MKTDDDFIKGKKCTQITVWPSAWCIDGDTLWMVHGKINGLFKYDLVSQQVQYVCSFKDEEMIKESSMTGLIKTSSGILSIPVWGNHIHYISDSNMEDTIISIPKEADYRNKRLFSGAFYFDEKIYCIPMDYEYILSINSIDNSVNIEYELKKYLSDCGIKETYINQVYMEEDGNLYASITGTNKVFNYNLVSKEPKIITIGEPDNKYTNVLANEHILYVCEPNKSVIYLYNKEQRVVVKQISVPLDRFCIRKFKDEIIIIDSVIDGKVITYDGKEMHFHESQQDNLFYGYRYDYCHGLIIQDEGTKKFYYDRYAYELCQLNADGSFKASRRKIVAEINLSKFKYPKNEIIIENRELGIDWFLSSCL